MHLKELIVTVAWHTLSPSVWVCTFNMNAHRDCVLCPGLWARGSEPSGPPPLPPSPQVLRAQQVLDPLMHCWVTSNPFSLTHLPTLSFFCSAVGGNSSDSDTDVGTTVLNLQPRARCFLPEQFSKKGPQPYKMEWKNEVDVDSGQGQPCAPPTPHSKEGGTQTPGMLRQPLLSKGQFGPVKEDGGTEGVLPKPPPRLVRRASEPGNRKAQFGSEKP